MSIVSFRVEIRLPVAASDAWAALVDWAAHGDWIPATRSQILEGDGGLGTVFVATSGFGRAALVDRMRVVRFDAASLSAEVEKIGPVLHGAAGFTVTETPDGCSLSWFERVQVPVLPRFLAPVAALLGAQLFRFALRRLAVRLR